MSLSICGLGYVNTTSGLSAAARELARGPSTGANVLTYNSLIQAHPSINDVQSVVRLG